MMKNCHVKYRRETVEISATHFSFIWQIVKQKTKSTLELFLTFASNGCLPTRMAAP